MKNLTYTIGLVALLFGQAAQANTIILPSLTAEPSLLGAGGILDMEFGLADLQRVNDNSDQYWNASAAKISVTAVAKYAGFTQVFGVIDGSDTFTPLLTAPPIGQTNTVAAGPSLTPFRFGLDPSGSPLFSSDPSDNSTMDHMVSWLITGGQYKGDYVVAWEDLKSLGDQDYNDLVVRVSGVSNVSAVPVPAAVWLFGSGLIALATITRRRA